MDKRIVRFNVVLLPLAIITGWSFSKATLVGKVGIHILHKELTFLNSWWKGSLFVWAVWILLELIQFQIWKKYPRKTNMMIQGALIFLAFMGLLYTYFDFRTFTHSLLGERFHIGGYLFWIVWIIICFFFINLQNKRAVETNDM
jgi:hypothetical protein